jgi:DNA-binding MarR family transcriptional regulator
MSIARDTELALLVDRLMRRIQFGLQKRAPDFNRKAIGPGGGIVLMTLKETGQISLNELTKRVARDKSQMTRTIRSLEDKGLVVKEPFAEDARVSLISLTPEGETVVAELMSAVVAVLNEILNPISAAEKGTLQALLQRAVA